MPIDSNAPSTLRPWVRHEQSAFERFRPSVPKETPAAAAATRPEPDAHRLPPSRGKPLEVSNTSTSWWNVFSTPKHPQAQEKALKQTLEHRERTQVKLNAACQHLISVRDEHAFTSMTDRIYCGGGLFNDHGHCTAESLALNNVMHYIKKLDGLEKEHAAMLKRNPAQPE